MNDLACGRVVPRWLAALLLMTLVTPAPAREEWFRRLDLEGALARADLVLVARVAEVSEAKVIAGGKAERVLQQFQFDPLRTLKGVFMRDVLSLTSDDLGVVADDRSQLERGQVRVLFLGRSAVGYVNQNQLSSFDQSLPLVRDEKDPLLSAVEALIAVTQQHDRAKKVALLLDGLKTANGPSAVALLAALPRRALLAAQALETAGAVTKHLGDPSPAVREAAARALQAVLEADYLEHGDLRTGAVAALAASLQKGGAVLTARVAALDALGVAGAAALNNAAATRLLSLDQPRTTLAEQAALLQGIGRLGMVAQRKAVETALEHLPLDAPEEVQRAAGLALVRLDAAQALKALLLRIQSKSAADLEVPVEIRLLGELPAAPAAPALLGIFKRFLQPTEKLMFAEAGEKLADPSLVPALATLLDPRRRELRWHAVEALRKIDTEEAAEALRPHLREEADLFRKLQIAAFLGRHGIHDGYPYAMEHISEPQLLRQALAALAAMRDPRAVPTLRTILKKSNDHTWNAVAVQALGALGDKERAPRFLEMVQDLKHPLAPAALIALGDLGEVKALPKVAEGLTSRNDRVVLASARAAGKLIARAGAKTDALRDQLAMLLTDADAPPDVRGAALDALIALDDPRLDRALVAVARDAGLEGSELLERAEKLLRQRKVKMTVP